MQIIVENPLKVIFRFSSSIFCEKRKNEKKSKKRKFFVSVGAIVLGPKVLPKNLVTGRHFGEYNIIHNTKFVLYSLALNHSIFLHSLTLWQIQNARPCTEICCFLRRVKSCNLYRVTGLYSLSILKESKSRRVKSCNPISNNFFVNLK